jgi:hypothetical protein
VPNTKRFSLLRFPSSFTTTVFFIVQVLPELSLEDTALFFARAGAAAYDASITGWKVSWRAAADPHLQPMLQVS